MKITFYKLTISLIFSVSLFGQNTDTFPATLIDSSIINKRNLQPQVEMLTSKCNCSERIGKKIDVFWIKTPNGNLFGHSYEYFMVCDNLRLIYWYDNPEEKGKPVDFMIENLEDESKYVVAKRKHLKNKKRYKYLLEK